MHDGSGWQNDRRIHLKISITISVGIHWCLTPNFPFGAIHLSTIWPVLLIMIATCSLWTITRDSNWSWSRCISGRFILSFRVTGAERCFANWAHCSCNSRFFCWSLCISGCLIQDNDDCDQLRLLASSFILGDSQTYLQHTIDSLRGFTIDNDLAFVLIIADPSLAPDAVMRSNMIPRHWSLCGAITSQTNP